MKVFAQRTLASLTMATTILSLSGVAFAVAPADYGLTEGNVIRATGDPDIYIVNEHGYKRLFTSPAIFNVYGHIGWASVKEVSEATRNAFGTSGLFRNCESGDQKVYGLEVASEDAGVLHWVNVSGADAVSQDANFFKKVFCINNAEMALYTMGSAYTALSQVPTYTRGGETPGPVSGFDPNGDSQGSILSVDLGSADEDTLMEDQDDQEVYVVEFDMDDEGPLMITSLDLWFGKDDSTGDSAKPWDFFTEVCVYLDGSKLACKDVDSSGDWSDDEDLDKLDSQTISEEYRLRFTSLAGVLESDELSKVSVEVSTIGNLDSADEDADWYIELGQYRVLDESGLVTTEENDFDTSTTLEQLVEFDMLDEGAIEARDASTGNDAQVVEIDENADTTGVAVYSFILEETGDVDVTIRDIRIDLSTSDSVTDVFKRAYLYQGTTKVGEETVPSSGQVVFEDIDVEVAAEDEETFTVKVDFNDAGTDSTVIPLGTTVGVDLVSTGFDAEDANGNEDIVLTDSGASLDDNHALYATGIRVVEDDVDATKDSDSTPDIGTFEIVVKVTAFGDDVWVYDECGAASSYFDYDFDGTASESTCTLMSTGDEEGSGFKVAEGSTETFTLTVAAQAQDEFLSMMLGNIRWGLDNDADDYDYTFNLDDIETGSIYLSEN
jgi:hypothetical protein